MIGIGVPVPWMNECIVRVAPAAKQPGADSTWRSFPAKLRQVDAWRKALLKNALRRYAGQLGGVSLSPTPRQLFLASDLSLK
jgi:hypothetical protein